MRPQTPWAALPASMLTADPVVSTMPVWVPRAKSALSMETVTGPAPLGTALRIWLWTAPFGTVTVSWDRVPSVADSSTATGKGTPVSMLT